MKKLVDTCVWIEWITNGRLAETFSEYLLKTSDLIVPTLVQYELYKWTCREKNRELALEIIGVTENANVVPLDANIALYAAEMSNEYGLAMSDAVVYATSERSNSIIITCDKHFKNLPNVKYFEKKK